MPWPAAGVIGKMIEAAGAILRQGQISDQAQHRKTGQGRHHYLHAKDRRYR